MKHPFYTLHFFVASCFLMTFTATYEGSESNLKMDKQQATNPSIVEPLSPSSSALIERNLRAATSGYPGYSEDTVNGKKSKDILVEATSFHIGQTDNAAALSNHGSLTDILLGTSNATCDTINWPIPPGYSIIYYLVSGNGGFVSGNNKYGDKAKGNFFDMTGSNANYLTKVIIGLGPVNGATEANLSKVVNIKVFDGTSGTPGAVIGTYPSTLGEMKTRQLNLTILTFSSPVILPASKKIFLALEFPSITWTETTDPTINDTITLLSTASNQPPINLAWEQWADDTWHSFEDVGGWGFKSIFHLYPIVSETADGCNCIDAEATTIWFKDADNDGYSDGDKLTKCYRPDGYKLANELLASSGDCNDNNAAINPGKTEICNGIDDDCDAQTDEGCTIVTTWYRDADKDGFGNPNPAFIKIQSTKPRNYVANNLDCRDWDPESNPDALEKGDGIDNNCNGLVDEDLPCLQTWYYDGDGDKFGSDAYTRLSCIQHNGFVPLGGDCKNWDASVHPGAQEICDGKDNNCNGMVDESCTPLIVSTSENHNKPKTKLDMMEAKTLEIRLFPNPVKSVLTVELDAFVTGQKVELQLMQVDGKVQLSQSLIPSVKSEQVRLNVNHLESGFYVLQVKQGVLKQIRKVMVVR